MTRGLAQFLARAMVFSVFIWGTGPAIAQNLLCNGDFDGVVQDQ